MDYYWIRIFDYHYCDDSYDKGTLLDEYYLFAEGLTRDQCKKQVAERSHVDRFAKPRSKDGIYAIVGDSNEFWYERFNKVIDTYCFNCGAHIQGREKDFPHITHEDQKYYHCSYDCKREVYNKLHAPEGEWQDRDGYSDSGVFGYIYHIYNRKTNKHYIGQSQYMPFFRWQEHVKASEKGDICDLIFETVTVVKRDEQKYLNSIEAWWIQKYIEDYGKDNVMNISVPRITIDYLVDEFNSMFFGVQKLNI